MGNNLVASVATVTSDVKYVLKLRPELFEKS